MEKLLYYFTLATLFVNAIFGVFLVSKGLVGLMQGTGNGNVSVPALSNGALLLSGTVNMLLAVTFYRLLRPDLFSSILIIASFSAFSLWEMWIRSKSSNV